MEMPFDTENKPDRNHESTYSSVQP